MEDAILTNSLSNILRNKQTCHEQCRIAALLDNCSVHFYCDIKDQILFVKSRLDRTTHRYNRPNPTHFPVSLHLILAIRSRQQRRRRGFNNNKFRPLKENNGVRWMKMNELIESRILSIKQRLYLDWKNRLKSGIFSFKLPPPVQPTIVFL